MCYSNCSWTMTFENVCQELLLFAVRGRRARGGKAGGTLFGRRHHVCHAFLASSASPGQSVGTNILNQYI